MGISGRGVGLVWVVALVPSVLLWVGAGAMSVGAGFEHVVYGGMACRGTASMPGAAAACYSLAMLAAIAGLTIAMVPFDWVLEGVRDVGRASRVVSGVGTVISGVGSVAVVSRFGPRDQHGRDPIAGGVWLMVVVAGIIAAVTVVCCLSLWRARGVDVRTSGVWVIAGLGVLVCGVVLGEIGGHWWVDGNALVKVCWYGLGTRWG